MSENTVYLLYNTNATNVQLHLGSRSAMNRSSEDKNVEYIANDEFTITYSLEDERKYTDIKILSKTKLKARPKSAHELQYKLKGSVEGILIRRSNSFSTIERDLFTIKRSPLIKPLLSETEITRLQQLQKECRDKKLERDEKETVLNQIKKHKNLSQVLFENIALGAYKDLKDLQNGPHEKETREDLKQGNFIEQKFRGKSGVATVKSGVKQSENQFKKSTDFNQVINSKTKPLNNASKQKPAAQRKEFQQKPNLSDKKSLSKRGQPKPETERLSSKEQQKRKISHKRDVPKDDIGLERKQRSRKKKSLEKGSSENLHETYAKRKNSPSATPKEKEISGTKLKDSKKKLQVDTDKDSGKENDSQIKKETMSSKGNKKEPKSRSESSSKENEKPVLKDSNRVKGRSNSHVSSKISSNQSGKENSKSTKMRKGNSDSINDSFENGDKKKTVTKSKKAKTINTDDTITPKGKLLKTKKGSPEKFSMESRSENLVNTEKSGNVSASSKKRKSKDEVKSLKRKRASSLLQNMIHYVLSNPIFTKMGWTLKPNDPIESRLVTFEAEPANPQNFFMKKRDEGVKYYPSGNLAMKIQEDGNGQINYPSGSPAVVLTKNGEASKITLYSDKEVDPLLKDSHNNVILGHFNSCGNGVVYDHQGRKILHFNQMEGVYDQTVNGIPYKWQWDSYKVLKEQQIKVLMASMVNEAKKSPPSSDKKSKHPTRASNVNSTKKPDTEKQVEIDKAYADLLAELPYPVPQNCKTKKSTHKYGFKPIILKINNEMALRINGQEHVVLNFKAKRFSYKIEMGVKIVPDKVAKIHDFSEININGIPCVF